MSSKKQNSRAANSGAAAGQIPDSILPQDSKPVKPQNSLYDILCARLTELEAQAVKTGARLAQRGALAELGGEK